MTADLGIRLRGVRPLLALGAVVLGIGGLVDVAYHAASAALRLKLETFVGVDGEVAHLAIFAGMALVVLGLVEVGVRGGRQSAVRQTPRPGAVRTERLVEPVASAQPDRQPHRSGQRPRA